LIYGFYKMLSASDNKEDYNYALKVVKWAAIAILLMGVTRFLVSWFFEVFFLVRDET
jgi:hypothetical protein